MKKLLSGSLLALFVGLIIYEMYTFEQPFGDYSVMYAYGDKSAKMLWIDCIQNGKFHYANNDIELWEKYGGTYTFSNDTIYLNYADTAPPLLGTHVYISNERLFGAKLPADGLEVSINALED